MFRKTEINYKKEENNDQPCNRWSLFLNNLTEKRRFIQLTSITVSFDNYQRVGLCPTQNEVNSATSTLFRKKKVKNNESINRNWPTSRGNKWLGQQWRDNHPRSRHYKKMECDQQGQGHGKGVHRGRGGHQGRGGRGGHLKFPSYTPYTKN